MSFSIARGAGHVLLGENGAGKSTLINLLGGLFSPDEGSIRFDRAPYRPASPLQALKAGIRVVHQELHLLSNLSVAENLLFERLPRRHGLVRFREMNRRAAELLAEVGLQISPTAEAPPPGWASRRCSWSRSPKRSPTTASSWCWTSRPRP